MLFTITGKHVEITEAIKKHAKEKTAKLPKYYDKINQVEVVIGSNEGSSVDVEIIARAQHNTISIAKEIGTDAYACIDIAVHKLDRNDIFSSI